MKYWMILLSLGMCFSMPMLSQGKDIRPLIRITNEHNGQYNALDTITDTKFYGSYQFRVLKNAVETAGNS